MAKSKDQILALVKEPAAKSHLDRARKNEHRIQFHTDEAQTQDEASPYKKDFSEWVAKILPADKKKMFDTLLEYPVYTTELIKSIAEEYIKVYNSQNSSFTYEFSNEQQEADFKTYLKDIDFWNTWKQQSFENMFSHINSVLIVDMPSAPTVPAKPYYYFQNIDSVIDVGLLPDSSIAYLICNQGDSKILFLDTEEYVMLEKKEGSEEYSETSRVNHFLGYCPAKFFWDESITRKKPIIKRSPLSPALTNLNWLLFFETSRRCLETYAAYPIFVSFKEKCSYYEEKNGQKYQCTGGKVNRGEFGTVDCPSCSKNKLIGPGSMFRITPPASKDQPNNIDAVKVIPAEKVSLEYCKERSTELWDEIYFDCVGYGGDEMQNQAVNEKQVRAGFESKQNILFGIKKNLEAAHKFLVETIAKMRYENGFIAANINYGTDFYLKSSADAVKEYTDSKNAGAPQYYLSYKRNQIDSISTKGNENDAERLNILRQLEPWIDMSLKECKEIGLNEISPDEFMIKADFSRLIQRFENEYGSITEFGKLVDPAIKIQRIIQKLLQYVRDTKTNTGGAPEAQ